MLHFEWIKSSKLGFLSRSNQSTTLQIRLPRNSEAENSWLPNQPLRPFRISRNLEVGWFLLTQETWEHHSESNLSFKAFDIWNHFGTIWSNYNCSEGTIPSKIYPSLPNLVVVNSHFIINVVFGLRAIVTQPRGHWPDCTALRAHRPKLLICQEPINRGIRAVKTASIVSLMFSCAVLMRERCSWCWCKSRHTWEAKTSHSWRWAPNCQL